LAQAARADISPSEARNMPSKEALRKNCSPEHFLFDFATRNCFSEQRDDRNRRKEGALVLQKRSRGVPRADRPGADGLSPRPGVVRKLPSSHHLGSPRTRGHHDDRDFPARRDGGERTRGGESAGLGGGGVLRRYCINSPPRHPSACSSPTGFVGSVKDRRGVGGGSERFFRCRGEIRQASFTSGGELSEFPRLPISRRRRTTLAPDPTG
jgi:hypothetical protein